MFTNKKAKYYGDDKVLLDSACLSTDTKPTTGVANGSKCIEMDTGKTYMFNEEDSEWEELPSSGGGGSSDFSTATLTVINNTGMEDTSHIDVPYLFEYKGDEVINTRITTTGIDAQAEYTIIIKDGSSTFLVFTPFAEESAVMTGYATEDDDEEYLFLVTGDCTITIS